MVKGISFEGIIQKKAEELIAEGKIVEADFLRFQVSALSTNMPEIMQTAVRGSFFAGALCMYQTFLQELKDPKATPGKVLQKMELLREEFENFKS